MIQSLSSLSTHLPFFWLFRDWNFSDFCVFVFDQVNREYNTIGLRILAEDVRIWMETNGCSNAQILSAPYINLGNEIVKCKVSHLFK
jgi:hypothetical protein